MIWEALGRTIYWCWWSGCCCCCCRTRWEEPWATVGSEYTADPFNGFGENQPLFITFLHGLYNKQSQRYLYRFSKVLRHVFSQRYGVVATTSLHKRKIKTESLPTNRGTRLLTKVARTLLRCSYKGDRARRSPCNLTKLGSLSHVMTIVSTWFVQMVGHMVTLYASPDGCHCCALAHY